MIFDNNEIHKPIITKVSLIQKILKITINFIEAIKISAIKSVRGEENFWIVLFGWGVCFYATAMITGIISLFVTFRVISGITSILSHGSIIGAIAITLFFLLQALVGTVFLIFLFVYPILFAFGMLKCSIKRSIVYTILAIELVIIFLIFHYAISSSGFFIGLISYKIFTNFPLLAFPLFNLKI